MRQDQSNRNATHAVALLDCGLPVIGETLENCTIESIVHIGDMAVTYRVRSEFSGGPRIIKVCRPYSSRAYRRCFVLKRNLHARLDDPRISATISGGTYGNDLPTAIRNYHPGVSLDELGSIAGPFPLPVALAIAAEIAEILSGACKKIEQDNWAGYVYRCIWSVQPSHVIVTSQGHLRVIDIGLDQFFDDRLPFDRTWEDIPPPQYSSVVDQSTILFSLGILLLQLTQGFRRSIDAMSIDNTPAQLDSAEPTLSSLVRACISKSSAGAFGTLDHVRDALRSCLRKHSASSPAEIIRHSFGE